MSTKKFMERLKKLDGAVSYTYDPFSNIVQTPSPSFNFIFGNTHGLPLGYSLLLYGPEKGGKSLISNAMIGQLHKDDPEAIAIKFNTEMRETGQLTQEKAKIWGIDLDRYQAFDVNSPDLIFDPITKEINAMCQEGAKVKLIIIDSLSNIQGRRAMNADTVMTQQIGDQAATLQAGLQTILPVIRTHKIALICTSQIRAEMDQLEQMRGNKYKPSVNHYVKHFCEYSMWIEQNRNSKAKEDLLGHKFVNEELGDMSEKGGEVTGHKVRAIMKSSTLGPKGRTAEFTIDYSKGIVNTEEEVFTLGCNRGIVERPNNVKYAFDGREWHGKPAFLQALKDEPSLCAKILSVLKQRDLAGLYGKDETETEESA